jgi:hypothetical protein
LILIGIGVGLLLRFTPVAAIGGVIVAATAGMLVGAVLAGGIGGFAGSCSGTAGGGETTSLTGTFGDRARVDIELTCAALAVERQAGPGWTVDAAHASGRQPTIEAAADQLTLRTEGGQVVLPFGDDTRRDWRVTLPLETALSANITLNASNAVVGLGGGPLESLNGTFNASDARLDAASATDLQNLNLTFNAASGTLSLPAVSMAGNVTLNASSLTMCVAPEAGLRIAHSATLSSDNFGELGLTQSGEAWQTADYGSAAQRIDINVSSNVSSITLSRTGGCQ